MDTVVLMWTTFIVSLVEFEVLFYEVFLLVIVMIHSLQHHKKY